MCGEKCMTNLTHDKGQILIMCGESLMIKIDKGLLFHTKPRWKNFAKWKNLKMIPKPKSVMSKIGLKPEMKKFFCKKMEKVCEMKISKSSKKCHE
jgi:hypothetical protein